MSACLKCGYQKPKKASKEYHTVNIRSRLLNLRETHRHCQRSKYGLIAREVARDAEFIVGDHPLAVEYRQLLKAFWRGESEMVCSGSTCERKERDAR